MLGDVILREFDDEAVTPAPLATGALGAGPRAPEVTTKAWHYNLRLLGGFIRTQRQLAQLSLRELAELANVSKAYLSQIERGLHEPSARVIKAIADALQVSADVLLAQAGILQPHEGEAKATEDVIAAIGADSRLTQAQKTALLTVYRSYVAKNEGVGGGGLSSTEEALDGDVL